MIQGGVRPIDRRTFGRRETAIAAVAIFEGSTRRQCIVRNFSSTGALLEFQGRIQPSERFVLVIEGNSCEGGCILRHHAGNKVGVLFKNADIVKIIEREYQQRLAEADLGFVPEQAPSRPSVSVVPVSATVLRHQVLGRSYVVPATADANSATTTVRNPAPRELMILPV